MEEISNKTLATLLIASIVISLGGTIVALNKLGTLGGLGYVQITGRATTDTGTAAVSVSESVSITLIQDSVNFGTGWVDTSIAACDGAGDIIYLSTLGQNNKSCFTDGSPVIPPSNTFVVENDGTVNVSVHISGDSNLTLFSTGSAQSTYEYKWNATDNESTSCGSALQTSEKNFDENASACDQLYWDNNNDRIKVDVYVKFPYNIGPANYQDSTISFQAFKTS